MTESSPSGGNAGTSPFPALTTTFTPPPQCTDWYISACSDTSCYAEAFPTGTGICGGSGGSASMISYACYPEVALSTREFANGAGTYTLEVATYSPGLYCPLGMSVATSVPLLDGVFCCPSGMRFQGDLEGGTCARTQTEGTFIVSTDCTSTTVPGPTGSLTTTVSIYAMPIFLGGRKLADPSSSPISFTTMSSSESTTPTTTMPVGSGNSSDPGPSTSLVAGLAVGISLAIVLLLAVCVFWFMRRYRRKMAWRLQGHQGPTSPEKESTELLREGKPELAASTAQRPELDPLATRAELEAPPEENGAGIYVHKPELQGTDPPSEGDARRGYVKRKGELEAFTARHGGS